MTDSVKSVINVTTDKVYLNKEWDWGYREYEELNGFDPYSNSKSCSELVTASYKNSFFADRDIAISTCRAGNEIMVRNFCSIRAYQHVLKPVMAYLLIVQKQYKNKELAGNYNIGPNESDCFTTGDLVNLFCKLWNQSNGKKISWKNVNDGGPNEASFLKLDCSLVKRRFGWQPMWNIGEAMEKIIEWNSAYLAKSCINKLTEKQITEYLEVQI